jgi:ketosteroid isomerase-like protein
MTRSLQETIGYIDKQDAAGFVAGLTDDVVFTFGNHPSAVGHDAVTGAVEAFWSSIGGLRHRVQDLWEVEPDVTVVWLLVDYTRLDGQVVTVPCVDILRWTGDKISDWRIVIDVAPIYAPLDAVAAS